MRVDEPSRYNLRFELDIPLVRDGSRAPSEIAIEHYQVTLVRLGEMSDKSIARAELFRICPCTGEDVLLAADEIGCAFLERVCSEALDEDERLLIARAMSAADGVVAEAARRLQTDRPNLYRRMKRLGMAGASE